MERRILLPLGAILLLGTVALAVHTVLLGSYQQERKAAATVLQDGDILFQTMSGGQSDAIALATGSKWTHVGMAFQVDGTWMVYEAVGPVKATPLNAWIAQGAGGHYAAKRWAEAAKGLDPTAATALRKAVTTYLGRAYDQQFHWSDEKIYCSELVWKAYAEGLGVRLCEPKPLRAHALDSELVRRTMNERYGGTPPMDEPMIAPGALFACPLLVTVAER